MSRATRLVLLMSVSAVVATNVVTSVTATAGAATAPPTVARLSVTSGPEGGGTRVQVSGTNFVKGATVRFGTKLYGTAVNVTSSKSLWVTSPAHPAATADVRVHTTAGWSPITTKDRFTWVAAPVPPAVTGVSPAAGPTAGGTSVSITGTGFTTASTVAFGDAAAASVQYVSATRLTAVSPAHDGGTVDVRVTARAGTSTQSPNDQFTYTSATAPDSVSDLVNADVTTTTLTLRWTNPTSTDLAGVVVRRTLGGTPPAGPGEGVEVAVLPKGRNAVVDSGLAADTSYSYAVFAFATGPLYSDAATLTATTSHNSRPDVPSALTTSPMTRGGGSCATQPYGAIGALGGTSLVLAATVSDADSNQSLSAHFGLWDATASSPVLIADGTDGPRPSGRFVAIYRVAESTLVDGHLYRWNVVADDGSLTSAPTNPCYFRTDFDAPTGPVVTSPDSTFQVGTPAHFHITSSEPTPAEGRASGFDHFEYSFSSSSGPWTSAPGVVTGSDGTLDLTSTPTAWGTNYLFVRAIDRAGNSSSTATYSFYVRS